MTTHFTGKVVCVTGAGGSIGSEICRRLVALGVRELRMLGHSELPLYELGRELNGDITFQGVDIEFDYPTKKVPVLGDVCDEDHMNNLLEGVDIVIHAAAHKHVPLCETNPLAAIETNIGGTNTLARAAIRNSVPQFCFISSDKAVKPASVMGATKRVAELIVNYWSIRSEKTKFTTVRFGNVLNSSGSVLPLWREQLARGQNITLTDERCERFFMSIPDAVDLVLGTLALPKSCGLFVLDMGAPRRMIDLALETIRDHLRDTGEERFIEISGLRPGEKLTEELSYGGDVEPTEIARVMQVREPEPAAPLLNTAFSDLLAAARLRNRYLATTRLWECVK